MTGLQGFEDHQIDALIARVTTGSFSQTLKERPVRCRSIRIE